MLLNSQKYHQSQQSDTVHKLGDYILVLYVRVIYPTLYANFTRTGQWKELKSKVNQDWNNIYVHRKAIVRTVFKDTTNIVF